MSKAVCASSASWLALGLMLAAAPNALMAQDAPAPTPAPAPATAPAAPAAPEQPAGEEPVADDGDAIIVEGLRPRGSVEGDVKPEQVLTPDDILSYGATNVGELLEALSAAEGGEAAGPAVVLLNGKRISGQQEIRDIPQEAIQRVDILPPEVALTYGYEIGQRVRNIVLVPTYAALTATTRAGIATRGGRETGFVNATLQTINGNNRLNISLTANVQAKLLESERDYSVIDTTPQYALPGNIYNASSTLAVVDPALSPTATVVGVPANAVNGPQPLSAFVPGAGNKTLTDIGDFRTIAPRNRNFGANVSYARALGGVSASINGNFQRNQSLSLQGLPDTRAILAGEAAGLLIPAGSPFSPFSNDVRLYRYFDQAEVLSQRSTNTSARIGGTIFGPLAGSWNWSATGSYDYGDNRSKTNRGVDFRALQAAVNARDPAVNPYGPIAANLLTPWPLDTAHTKTQVIEANANLSGTLIDVPAGQIRLTAIGSFNSRTQNSRSVRISTGTTVTEFKRDVATGRLNLFVPLTSRREGFLDAIGDLRANANFAIQDVSDFGSMTSYGYGLQWQPITEIRLSGSVNYNHQAPSGDQLNAAVTVTPNVAIFDYRTGRTVFVTRTSGANPNLRESDIRRMNFSANIRPFSNRDWTFNASYTRTRSSDTPNQFPAQTPTAEIEAAFPERFTRDASGILTAIDARPVNYSRTEQSQLRYGINMVFLLGSPPPPPPQRGGGAGQQAGLPGQPNAQQQFPGGGRGGFGGFGGGRGGFGGGGRGGFGGGRGGAMVGGRPRLTLELFHTWRFVDTILIRPGLPIIDNLGGGSTNGRGGPTEHRIEANFNFSIKGFVGRFENDWSSSTRSSSLIFGERFNTTMQLTADFKQMPKLLRTLPMLKASSLTLMVNNLFDTYQKVTPIAGGTTPTQYEPQRQRGVGRTASLTFRKIF